MSMSLSVYLLDVAATRALVGSRDDQLLQVISDQFGDELTRADQWFDQAIAQGAPTSFEALQTVVHGGPFPQGGSPGAFQYGYAYKRLCSLTGSHLDNSSFSPYRAGWLEAVDEGLKALKVTAVSIAEFGMWEGMPDGLPWSDFPGCGQWTHGQCVTALEQFETANRAGLEPSLEPEVENALSDCVDWIVAAAQRPGYGVIGFQS
ncbi:DUF7691 family protein [Streptomyces sp. NBC_00557]|uniref:DUF7691 family protein n=1 Tax=Streptomyces sp. NBC_00557 TaxID=2975776 RepID=UPI002E814868|nr:hypothetical protein [Streptomyces sp. NBC_00557]WUC39716.1 hypothetical protein OG956_38840 [Streptomyces sp. NBC_00557]